MQQHGSFSEIAIDAIRPQGWLREFLQRMRDGLTGHPEAAGYPFDWNWWGSAPTAEPARPGYPVDFWGPYEQTAYWIDGALRCGYLLDDEALIERARQPLEWVLAHADGDGYLGPRFMKEGAQQSRWPHAVLFRALMAHGAATGEARIAQALSAHYRSGTSPHSRDREVCHVEAMLWAYARTGEKHLLEQALQAHREYQTLSPGRDTTLEGMLADRRSAEHGVTYCEIGKLGAILYLHTGDRTCLAAAVHAFRKLERDQVLVDGVPSSAEMLGDKEALASHETCVIADYTWSLGYLLMATGEAAYADRIERACFNAAPGAVRSDFRALQYFSCPNQVVVDRASNHNLFFRGYGWMSYRPNPGTECCPGNVHRILPNFAARQWLRDREGGLVAALYGPGAVTAAVGEKGQVVTVAALTDYPFAEQLEFVFSAPEPVEFPFTFRIPGWCSQAQARVNEAPLAQRLAPGTFVTLRRRFADGDRIRLTLPMGLRLSRWPEGGVAVERGPLVYALRIQEEWRMAPDDAPPGSGWRVVPAGRRSAPGFPNWDLYPASPWNYALALGEEDLESQVGIATRPVAADPWRPDTAPVELRVPVRRVRGWELERSRSVRTTHMNADNTQLVTERMAGDFALTPPLPFPASLAGRLEPETEMATLIPYGCARLRIAVFPQATSL